MFKKVLHKFNFRNKKEDFLDIRSPPISETNSYNSSIESKYYSDSDMWTIKDTDSDEQIKGIKTEEDEDEEYNKFIDMLLEMYNY